MHLNRVDVGPHGLCISCSVLIVMSSLTADHTEQIESSSLFLRLVIMRDHVLINLAANDDASVLFIVRFRHFGSNGTSMVSVYLMV